MYILGYDIDMGHMEAVNLLSSNKYTEKQIVGFTRRWLYFGQDSDHLTGLPGSHFTARRKQRPFATRN